MEKWENGKVGKWKNGKRRKELNEHKDDSVTKSRFLTVVT